MKLKKYLNLVNVLFIIYCVLLIWIILFKLSFSTNEITNLVKVNPINLIPFRYYNGARSHLKEIIQNIIIFIPFGVYLKMLNKNNKQVILYGFIFSLVLEISQFIFKLGACDITDIITNTSGTILGLLGYLLLVKLFKNKDKINNVLKIIALIVTILFSSLIALLLIANM